MESPDRVERLAIKKAKAKAEAQRTDAYTRAQYAASARMSKAKEAQLEYDYVTAKKTSTGKGSEADYNNRRKKKFDLIKNRENTRNWTYRAKPNTDRSGNYSKNAITDEMRPSKSVQAMLDKKKK